jgi:hypothetical protein
MKKEDPMEKTVNPDHTALRAYAEDYQKEGAPNTARASLYVAYYSASPRRVYFSIQVGPPEGRGELGGYLGLEDLRRFAEVFAAAAELIEENQKAPAASKPESEEAPRA